MFISGFIHRSDPLRKRATPPSILAEAGPWFGTCRVQRSCSLSRE